MCGISSLLSQRIKIRSSTYQSKFVNLLTTNTCCIVIYQCCPNVLKYPIQALKSLVKTLRKIRRETIWYDVVVLVDYEIVPELCPSIWNLRSLYVAGSIYHISALYAMKNPELTVCMVLTFSLVEFFFRKRDIYMPC